VLLPALAHFLLPKTAPRGGHFISTRNLGTS